MKIALPLTALTFGIIACAPESSVDAAAELVVRDALGQTSGPAGTQSGKIVDIDVSTLSKRLANGSIRLIDVRTTEEVEQGIIPGAEHIELDSFDPSKLDLSDGREVVFYCRSGRRSSIAGSKLATYTGEPIKHLAGGILAWRAEGNRVEAP